jgi:hypothetical protein
MRKWQLPNMFFNTWDVEFMDLCFDDAYAYLVQGFEVTHHQGNRGLSCRLMYNPERDCCMLVPVPHLGALRDGIVD